MGNEANILKKALDILYNRKRAIQADIADLRSVDYEDSDEGRLFQIKDETQRNMLIAQKQYTDMDIKELLGGDEWYAKIVVNILNYMHQ